MSIPCHTEVPQGWKSLPISFFGFLSEASYPYVISHFLTWQNKVPVELVKKVPADQCEEVPGVKCFFELVNVEQPVCHEVPLEECI